MYTIEKNEEFLFVKFLEDFDYNDAQVVIRHLTSIKEYPYTNDIWMIGKKRAHIRLGELETMVHDFHCRCPSDALRTKTAIVVEEGLTRAVIELWVQGLQKRVSFKMRIFDRLDQAASWIGVMAEKVA